MADTQETIADIIAEMREIHVAEFQDYADRLEAAHRREASTLKLAVSSAHDALREVIEQNCSHCHKRELAAVGDAAKLREAIDKCVNLITEFGNAEIVKTPLDVIIDIEAILKAALAAPPRNCDRFATVDEARKTHEAICEKYGKCHHGCPLNNEEHYSAFDCFEAWLFAPVADREGGNDGN